MLSFLLGTFLPAMASALHSTQAAPAAPSPADFLEHQASTSKFSFPFNPREYEQYQHRARCTGIDRSTPDPHSEKEIQLRELCLDNPVPSCAFHWKILFHEWKNICFVLYDIAPHDQASPFLIHFPLSLELSMLNAIFRHVTQNIPISSIPRRHAPFSSSMAGPVYGVPGLTKFSISV